MENQDQHSNSEVDEKDTLKKDYGTYKHKTTISNITQTKIKMDKETDKEISLLENYRYCSSNIQDFCQFMKRVIINNPTMNEEDMKFYYALGNLGLLTKTTEVLCAFLSELEWQNIWRSTELRSCLAVLKNTKVEMNLLHTNPGAVKPEEKNKIALATALYILKRVIEEEQIASILFKHVPYTLLEQYDAYISINMKQWETYENPINKLKNIVKKLSQGLSDNVMMHVVTLNTYLWHAMDESADTEKVLYCRTCFENIPIRDEDVTVVLKKCDHEVCSSCVTKQLSHAIKLKEQLLRCPFCTVFGNCSAIMQEHEIQHLVSPNLFEEYLNMLLEKVKINAKDKIIYCKTYKCSGWCFVEGSEAISFSCPVCGISNSTVVENLGTKDETFLDVRDVTLQSERYNEMISLLENDGVPNFVSFECPICFNICESYEGLVLKNCLHTFCRECLANTILYSEDTDMKCPYNNGKYTCDEKITQCEIKAVLEPEQFQNYLKKSLLLAEREAGKSAYHCRTKNCSGWWFLEDGVERFSCFVCNMNNCFICQNVHEGESCINDNPNIPDIVKSEILIDRMLEIKTTIRCPRCGILIMKVDGCNLVVCAACKLQICWITGKPRVGLGPWDVSGGCNCTPLKRCHPLCHGCH